jgi:hypothetical protein
MATVTGIEKAASPDLRYGLQLPPPRIPFPAVNSQTYGCLHAEVASIRSALALSLGRDFLEAGWRG